MLSKLANKNIYLNEHKFTLLCGDSFLLLEKLEEKSVNMIFSDPPYFLSSGGISCKNGKQVLVDKGEWDNAKTIEEKLSFHRKWINLCRKALRDDGTIWISATLHSVYAIGVALEMEGFSIINNIIWQKPNPAPNLGCRCFTHSTETVIWARKQLTSKKKGRHSFDYQLMKEQNGGKQMKDVWLFDEEVPELWTIPTTPKREKKEGTHPTQKPLELLKRIILASTKEDDLVLDPFNGSGTTGIACKLLDRRYIGIDNDEEFLNLTKKRYEVLVNEKLL